ncbi:MAG: polysaccharide biosynthesis protein [Planctomycetes bacterium]|jgi:FlaA1/EpsC-like NDP-sugar epimerase|nr:polysaccharide biosynthesis protein [Planctomycetota bacterium]
MEPTPTDSDTTQQQLSWLEEFLSRHRYGISVIGHVLIFVLSLLLAYLIRSDAVADAPGGYGWRRGLESFLRVLPFFLGLKIIIFWRLKLFRGGWQYAGIRDIARILLGCWLFVLIAFVAVYLFHRLPAWLHRDPTASPIGYYFSLMPRGVLVLDFLASVFLVSTVRLGYRIYREELRPISSEGVRRVLVIGAGDAGETVIREINRMRVERYRVVGLLDDEPAKQNLIIHGVPVLGQTEEIREVCEKYNIEEIIIAMPSATHKELQHVIELCTGTKLEFQSLPGVGELIDGKVTVSQIRPVEINDLLGREAVKLDDDAVARFIESRVVLVTGAGGSIGSEMCRQLCRYGPARLVLLEQAETPLFDIENELHLAHPDLDIVPRICDIYDRPRVMATWDEQRPDVVIHAAAHKHVPLMEHNPCEAIKNNVLGTKNVADASREYETAEFVTISTDKAVNPSSVMGCSKRVGELYTQALNHQPGCRTQFKAVRFGNVLGSAGSVVPTFRRQIAAGGPVTVTDPEMTRYFMTIPEAAQLVLQAAATGQGGQIFLLDMGEPVKIADLARQMITLSGFRPNVDIDIIYTGVRPGEKLFEELKTEGEDIEPTTHPKVMIWAHQAHPWPQVEAAIEELAALQNCMDRDPIVSALQHIVPEYDPLNPPGTPSRQTDSVAPHNQPTH